MTGDPPSDVTSPPVIAPVKVTDDAAVVVTRGKHPPHDQVGTPSQKIKN